MLEGSARRRSLEARGRGGRCAPTCAVCWPHLVAGVSQHVERVSQARPRIEVVGPSWFGGTGGARPFPFSFTLSSIW